MANVMFSSAKLRKDLTVYAAAGDRATILGLAKRYQVPIDCECEKGECGSCAVEVLALGKPSMGVHLTEKEKLTLMTAGRMKRVEFEDIELRDVAPRYRLACQYMLLDEDIVVKF